MLRQSLLFLSQSPTAQRLVSGTPMARQVAERFVAGETLDAAVAAARALNESGLTVTLDYLGESVSSRAEAEEATQMAIRTVERIASERIDGNLSLKPTQLGLDIDDDFCRENIARILERARAVGDGEGEIFVRIDMESSAHTERTLALVERLWADGFRNTGTVLQSYLYRTDADLERLIALGTRIRLVKGAYNEPATVAYPEKADVDRHFIEQMKVLLERGNYPAIATHDEAIIAETRRFAWETGVPKESFEFQMLYGIRRDLQLQLREDGYNVRTYVPFGGSWYPYLMRRLAERPANVLFIASNLAKESPLSRLGHPVALGAGVVAGTLAALKWGNRRNAR